ncbi:MAG: NADP-dependent malic enzyme [Clostridia bacterium]|nr:NADP-dependent malic enzyme [Clostridia bacterium]
MDIRKRSLEKHYEWRGKISIASSVEVKDMEALALAYTPGVAEPCLEIQKDIEKSYELTRRWNTVAVVTDGTAILGLGDIGPEAGMPVMEGKCLLFHEFAGIDAVPICIKSKDVDEIVRTVELISGSFGGINLEDISAPRCFEVERRLKEVCDIPVFHDDQHGTAIIAGAAVRNALRVVGKKLGEARIVINGAGSAGIAIGRLIMAAGATDVVFVDRFGAICDGDPTLTGEHVKIAKESNPRRLRGSLADVIRGSDVFIGVSAPGVLKPEMVRSMAEDPVIFAIANPTPEIMPDEAKAAGAAVVGTGRSDFPNQINNVLAFPGVFRGALDCRASDITEDMKLAASSALAALVADDELSAEYILPTPFDPRVVPAVSKAVADAARKAGIAKK